MVASLHFALCLVWLVGLTLSLSVAVVVNGARCIHATFVFSISLLSISSLDPPTHAPPLPSHPSSHKPTITKQKKAANARTLPHPLRPPKRQ